jgi:hypothetical protein
VAAPFDHYSLDDQIGDAARRAYERAATDVVIADASSFPPILAGMLVVVWRSCFQL